MISKYSVKKPFTILVAVILVLVLGTVSVTRMTPDLLPEMSFPYIVLFTSYVGAAPEEVEQTVSKPLEQALAALDDLKEIASTSSENYSTVYLTFEDSVNTDRAMLDIQQVVTRLKGEWPDAVGTPTVLELSTDLIPTVVAAVHYNDMDPIALSSFVNDTLVPALEGTNGVASVTATGLIIEQIEVDLNTEKIDRLNRILYGSIDEAAQEAFDEIDEARQKIAEGRDELANAREELDEGEKALQGGSWQANKALKHDRRLPRAATNSRTRAKNLTKERRRCKEAAGRQIKRLRKRKNSLIKPARN